MNGWLLLLLAAIFEIGWPVSFKLSAIFPEHSWLYLVIGVIAYAVSGVLLYLAQKTIPVSTAYVVWTGAGAVFTFLIGVFCFGDVVSWIKVVSVFMIVAGIAGLELC